MDSSQAKTSSEMSFKFNQEQPDNAKAHMSQPLHEDDKEAVAAGLSPDVAKARRGIREKRYANPINGGVHDGKLDFCVKMSYAPPSLTTVPVSTLITVYVVSFYEKIGATLGLLAAFQAFARGFDVITDPTMSYITDSCRTKSSGRRRPFLITGAPVYCIMLICLLAPNPKFDSVSVSIWFGVFYIMFFLTATYCNIPYDALAPELTDNEPDRNSLFFTCTLFDAIGGLCAVTLPVMAKTAVGTVRGNWDYKYKSCDNPVEVDGSWWIDPLRAVAPWPPGVGSGGSQAPPSVQGWRGAFNNMTATQNGFDFNNDCSSTVNNFGNETGYLATWCDCRVKADLIYNLDTERYAYFYTGLFFGLWALVTLEVCAMNVKERCQLADNGTNLGKPPPLIPAMLNTFNNKPFTLLLPAFILDSLGTSIITSLVVFFVRYIVQPEFSNPHLGCKPVGGSSTWMCSSDTVVAASVLAMLGGAFLFVPLWLTAANKLGKRNAWLLWSFSNGLTFLCYAPVGKGDVILCVIMSFFNGAPIGGKFLADTVMADVIDYDEFLTKERAEATYTMFKNFMPKIAAIPASAIPIALLSTFGHKPPVDGILQEQDQPIRTFIQVTIIYIPFLMVMGAFLLKLKYPLYTSAANEQVRNGIAVHHFKKVASVDPCSGLMYLPVDFLDEEIETVEVMNHFRGLEVIKDFQKNPKDASKNLLRKAKMQLAMASIWFFIFLVATASTFEFLVSEDPNKVTLQFVPVLCIVFMAIGITAMAGTFLRLRGARMIESHTPNPSALKKIRKQREDLAKLRNFDASIRRGCFFAREPAKKLADLELTSDISESEKFADMNKDANAATSTDTTTEVVPDSSQEKNSV